MWVSYEKLRKSLNSIDIVYQDAFSSEVNKELWSEEYFADIVKVLNNKAIITTYSIATPIRLSMSNNKLIIYQHILPNKRKATVALNYQIDDDSFKYIDMDKKILNNPSAKALRD
jgi:tRNA U34 5-methylaminomethyl-2-thiouridine-forming methyltransferase MnmC